jgi:predicted transcriptional regulator
MRTTVRLDDRVLAEAKKYAAETGRTLTSVLEDALRETLARRSARAKGIRPVRLRTAKGDGVRPGVDLDDTAALLALMES